MPRFGAHEGYNRFVLEWHGKVHATVGVSDGVATLSFDRKGHVNTGRMNDLLPSSMRPARVRPDGGGLTFRVPPGMEVHDHSYGNLVVIDLVPAPPVETAAAPPPVPTSPPASVAAASPPMAASPPPVEAVPPSPPAPEPAPLPSVPPPPAPPPAAPAAPEQAAAPPPSPPPTPGAPPAAEPAKPAEAAPKHQAHAEKPSRKPPPPAK
ncbi:MAG TPA: hypothetical protein VKS60_11525, partial [Stellaceae bacterium]|nr:hypothetical protein [Stellaceae bacterium]